MKACYVDESGTGAEPVATMVGILVDTVRMNRAKREWNDLLTQLRQTTDRNVVELKTSDFYRGRGVWDGVDGLERVEVADQIFHWLAERGHKVVYSAVVKTSYNAAKSAGNIPVEVDSEWRYMGLHLALAIQRSVRGHERNKGNTYLFFDEQRKETIRFPELFVHPPEWSDDYYGLKRDQERLSQIIDIPFFADSRYIGLLQLADFLAFHMRRWIELKEHLREPEFEREVERLDEWIRMPNYLRREHIYPRHGVTQAHALFRNHAPPCLMNL